MSKYEGYAHVKRDYNNHGREGTPDHITGYPIYRTEAKYTYPL